LTADHGGGRMLHGRQAKTMAKGEVEELIDCLVAQGKDIGKRLQPARRERFSRSSSAARTLYNDAYLWVRQVQVCIARWQKASLRYVSARAGELMGLLDGSLRSRFAAPPIYGAEDPELIMDDLLNELGCIIPVLRIRALRLRKRIRESLTGDELDHAEQLLRIEGQHEEAILRAAGVIAGVVLETHLSGLIDEVNVARPEDGQYERGSKRDGITSYADWLIGLKVIPPSEKKPIDRLAFIRNCCDHAPGGKLRAPTRKEVEDLIHETRQYITTIVFP